jgi:hypothetical protein
MAKIKQSIAVQRQIPEHIRENYPVFVEFIKSYYDFLQQTQQQNLETIHDVDTTLDEFIDRFKAELAKNFPIHLATDKAQILKHIREFYLARGSEESFKFLFRVLFNKEAELYYPSKQMLRVSDGRWKQDVSVFVDPEDNNKIDPQSLIGKFIYITNTKGVVVQTVVENAVMYNENIYEVFVEREYINTIDVNSVVSSDEHGTIGKILPCPTSVKVFKSGKGFKAGDIYALRTQLGRGCVIKITKVDSEGGIKSIQVIEFGLDYKTKFYSYLSSKELAAWEYVHPLKINTPYNPNAPAYNEKAAGFIDYGWAAKQTYFYYDTNIPVGDNAYASDRFFADPAYVGDVHQQFYNDASETVMDEDLAIIEIELGSVAKYPGYYQTANGFISDEMHIQDGSYYQAFSYVVRVEEELRRYADIVKALVHPSGMKIFSEYNIYHDLQLSPKIPHVTTVLQLPLFDHQPSTATPGDRGVGYTGYDILVTEAGATITTPMEGAAPVYSRQGKASLLPAKTVREIVSQPDNINIKWLQKALADITAPEDAPSKHVNKPFASVISQYIETVAKAYTKNHREIVSQPDNINIKWLQKALADITAPEDAPSKHVNKPFASVISQYIETVAKAYTKNHREIINQPDAQAKFVDTVKRDLQPVIDSQVKWTTKPLQDQIASISDASFRRFFKNLVEVITTQETRKFDYSKSVQEIATAIEAISKDPNKNVSDILQTPRDAQLYYKYKNMFETVTNTVTRANINSKALTEIQNILDANAKSFTRGFADNTSVNDSSIRNAHKYFVSTNVTLTDFIAVARSILLQDAADVTDVSVEARSATFGKNVADNYSVQDSLLASDKAKANSETINTSTNGRLRLQPYDQESYFAVFDDYQPATIIT